MLPRRFQLKRHSFQLKTPPPSAEDAAFKELQDKQHDKTNLLLTAA
jgi:hypothetical protein